MKIFIVLFVSLSTILFSCKKWGTKKTSVNGNVVNISNDSTVSGLMVELSYKFFDGSDYSIEEITTDEHGNFSFEFDAEKDKEYKISVRYLNYNEVTPESSDYPKIKNSSNVIIGEQNFVTLAVAKKIGLSIHLSKLDSTPEILDSIRFRHYHEKIKPSNPTLEVQWKTFIPQYDIEWTGENKEIFEGKNIFEYFLYKNGVETYFIDTSYAKVDEAYSYYSKFNKIIYY